MTEVNIREAKTHLSRLLQRVESGEEVVISLPDVLLRVLSPTMAWPHRVSLERGARVRVAPDFDQRPPEIEAAFRGGAQ